MSRPLETIETEVLQLPPAERAHLLDRVVASLDADMTLNAAWNSEVARRDAEIESGASSTLQCEAFWPGFALRPGDLRAF